ncbi:Insulin receptor substrate 2 [Galemys pyrenaicus]|uniref:Insulin receptor substrate 2 n=1 Tax=Galemys pyrenaicus TaxID=202257 RepID=A0A8J6AAE8_GALPY|nr:Insulin receptor substrate 2 [Galemys pyrenaicus]
MGRRGGRAVCACVRRVTCCFAPLSSALGARCVTHCAAGTATSPGRRRQQQPQQQPQQRPRRRRRGPRAPGRTPAPRRAARRQDRGGGARLRLGPARGPGSAQRAPAAAREPGAGGARRQRRPPRPERGARASAPSPAPADASGAAGGGSRAPCAPSPRPSAPAMASPPLLGPPNLNNNNNNNHGVRKCGYLRKQKHGHKRFFVLRGPAAGGDEAGAGAGGGAAPQPPRLEYYESEKKWRSKAGAPKRVIALDCCLNINKRADAKHKYLIALYTRDEYFAVAAENEQEQEGWYRALTDLVSEGRADALPSAASCSASLPGALGGSAGADDSYGLGAPAAYREVWQVTLKPKGLGQSKNLTGVYRLCLSARTVGFVKLNCEQPSVTLQLMNIRRCGHSDSFFFIEVGRSAVTGPGELWMQADDSVVAQNIHETILEAMKALKELFEFRPRSKSQSSGSSATHPISVPGARRHHHLVNLPPSQTGLVRRSRTDSLAATPPAAKCSSCRVRTASEGDGGAAAGGGAAGGRPVSAAGSPLSPGPVRAPLSRSHTLSGGCGGGRAGKVMLAPAGGALQHSRSMSMPVAHSPPAATSPGSLSSSSGHGSGSYPPPPGAHPHLQHPLHHPVSQRPSSGSASASGSPSDPGFMSLDEYGSSPGDLRAFCSHRSNTPESIAETPPARDCGAGELCGYMTMDRPLGHGGRPYRRVSGDGAQDLDRGLRKRTYSLTTPARQRPAPQPSSASLDEYTLMRATFSGSTGRLCPSCPAPSPHAAYHPYPEDYGDVEIGPRGRSGGHLGADDGYVPMTPGAALAGGGSRSDDYVPMSPTSVSAPKQILQPRAAAAPPAGALVPLPPSAGGRAFPGAAGSYKASSPAESSPEDSGYMRMWCGARLSAESTDGKLLPNGDYLNMSPSDAGPAGTPPDFFSAALHGGGGDALKGFPGYCYSSLPRSYRAPHSCNADSDQYVLMSSPVGRILEEERLEPGAGPLNPPAGGQPQPHHHAPVPSAGRPSSSGRPEGFLSQRCRAVRPTRLFLEGLQALPSMQEYPLPPEPKSPGEYINIDFGDAGVRLSPPAPPLLASAASSSSLLSASSPASSLGSGTPGTSSDSRQRSPLSDYMNLDFSSPKSPRPAAQSRDPVGSLDALLSPECPLPFPPLPPRPSAPRAPLQPPAPPPPPPPPGELYRRPPAAATQAASPSSSETGDTGDYTEMAFGVAATPPQPIAAPPKPEGARVTSPTSGGVKRLSLMDQVSGVEAFLQAGQPPDPHRGAKVIRADPQGGRRRHSSETFSSTTTVTPVSPSFAHNPKRHNSASVENVSLRKSSEGGCGVVLGGAEDPPTSPRQVQPQHAPWGRPWTPSQPAGLVGCPGGGSSPMRRETSAGFQNGLNYIAIDVRDEQPLQPADRSAWGRTRSLGGLISAAGGGASGGLCGASPSALPPANAYASIDFLAQHLKEATVVKGEVWALVGDGARETPCVWHGDLEPRGWPGSRWAVPGTLPKAGLSGGLEARAGTPARDRRVSVRTTPGRAALLRMPSTRAAAQVVVLVPSVSREAAGVRPASAPFPDTILAEQGSASEQSLRGGARPVALTGPAEAATSSSGRAQVPRVAAPLSVHTGSWQWFSSWSPRLPPGPASLGQGQRQGWASPEVPARVWPGGVAAGPGGPGSPPPSRTCVG